MTIRPSLFAAITIWALTGCGGGGSSTQSTSGAATTPASATSSAPSATTSAAQASPAAGDFCDVTAKTLDAANAYVQSMDAADHTKLAEAATAQRKIALASAPSEIKDDVRIILGLAAAAQSDLEGTAEEIPIEPQTPEQIKAAAGAWKTWTEKNCSAEVAARWTVT